MPDLGKITEYGMEQLHKEAVGDINANRTLLTKCDKQLEAPF